MGFQLSRYATQIKYYWETSTGIDVLGAGEDDEKVSGGRHDQGI
jgi:hypothetical protein